MDVQPVLMVVCREEGLVKLNGRLAGQVGPDAPLVTPVGPGAAVYLEYSPFGPGRLPVTRRLLLEGAGEAGDGVYLMAWPGGVWEAEVEPQGAESLLRAESGLPGYALEPDDERVGAGMMRVGPCRDGGRYAAAWDEGGRRIFCSRCEESYFTQTGEMRLFLRDGDTVGHARLITLRDGPDGAEVAEVEPMWELGAPRWPDTPHRTALAAAEAAVLGLWDEAEGYLSPEARERLAPVIRECGEYQCAAELPAPLPGGRSAVALCRATGKNTGEAQALTYHAVAGGGSQGYWRLDSLEWAR